MKITKAIIPVAGYGTRFLPITKTLNKTMLPILNRPLVDYVVADAVKAGVKEVFFVVLPGESQLRNYYSRDKKLEDYLLDRKAQDKYEQIADVHKQAKFHFVDQPQDGRYGTAIPVLLVQEFIERDEPFLVLMGDDFVFNADGSSTTQRLIDAYATARTDAAMAVVKLSATEISKYAAVEVDESSGQRLLKGMVEKPSPEQVTSEFSNISKYIFDYDIFDYLRKVQPNPDNGENYINDAILAYAEDKHTVLVQPIEGEYLDGGYLEGWLHANQVVAKAKGLL